MYESQSKPCLILLPPANSFPTTDVDVWLFILKKEENVSFSIFKFQEFCSEVYFNQIKLFIIQIVETEKIANFCMTVNSTNQELSHFWFLMAFMYFFPRKKYFPYIRMEQLNRKLIEF